MIKFNAKRVAVIGGGISGIAASKLASKKGFETILFEQKRGVIDPCVREELYKNSIKLIEGEHKKSDFSKIDLVILSPGVPVHKIKEFLNPHVPIISEIEFAYNYLKDEKIIGVTGTNGKTTTVGIISWVLNKLGIDHFVGGNYGVPLSDYVLNSKNKIILLELSSFQLQNIKDFRCNISVFLNFSENHLDFHRDMEEYFQCKLKIFKNQLSDDIAIINVKLKPILKGFSFNSQVKYFSKSEFCLENLIGDHNLENIAAAYQVCKELGISKKQFVEAGSSFKPFEHRLEYVGEIRGVKFYNDSKSTTLRSIEAAVNSFNCPVLLIAGGILKGGDPEKTGMSIKDKISYACVFGQSADIFYEKWNNYFPVQKVEGLKQALSFLFANSKKGDVILFSPGCSSFDMFENYKKRGVCFKKAVNDLIKKNWD